MHTKIYQFHNNAINWITYTTYLLYIAIALGLSTSAPEYLGTLTYWTKLYVSLFLIIRFNPFTRVKMTPLDAKIAFNAGVFLLISTAFNNLLMQIFSITIPNTNTTIPIPSDNSILNL